MSNYILVTGGAGYIGSHVCKALAGQGYTPVTLDNLSEGHADLVKWGPFEEANVLDKSRLRTVFHRYSISAVIHLAASAYIEESFARPEKYYKNNVEGTLSILDACRTYGCHRLIFSSSCAVYGIPLEMPIVESQRCDPINPYGRTKLTAERAIRDYSAAYALSFCLMRFFNAAGADDAAETGEDHSPEPHLIPRILDVASKKRPFLQINGDDFPTEDGSAVRDFIHVTDLANAHVRALKYLEAGGDSDVFNIGTGRGASVREAIQIAERITERSIPVRVSSRRVGDPPTLVADCNRLFAKLGFKVVESSLENIVETAWKWYRLRNNLR